MVLKHQKHCNLGHVAIYRFCFDDCVSLLAGVEKIASWGHLWVSWETLRRLSEPPWDLLGLLGPGRVPLGTFGGALGVSGGALGHLLRIPELPLGVSWPPIFNLQVWVLYLKVDFWKFCGAILAISRPLGDRPARLGGIFGSLGRL